MVVILELVVGPRSNKALVQQIRYAASLMCTVSHTKQPVSRGAKK